MRRFAFPALGLLVLLAALAGAGPWLLLADRTEAAIADWVAARRAEGFAIAHSGIEVGGFPTRVAVTIARPEVVRPGPGGALSWSGPAATFAASPWRSEVVDFTLPGVQQAQLSGRQPATNLRIMVRDVSGMLGPDDQARGWVLTAAGRDLGIAPYSVGQPVLHAPAVRLRLSTPEPFAPRAPLDFGIEIDRLAVPEPTGLFGATIDRLVVTGTLTPLPADLTADALTAWRAAGGAVVLHQGALLWGPLAAELTGRLTLDAALRPQGSLSARIHGYDAAIDILVRSGRIPAGNAAPLKLLARLLAARSGDGATEVPVRLEDGWLSVGPIRIAPLPALAAPTATAETG